MRQQCADCATHALLREVIDPILGSRQVCFPCAKVALELNERVPRLCKVGTLGFVPEHLRRWFRGKTRQDVLAVGRDEIDHFAELTPYDEVLDRYY